MYSTATEQLFTADEQIIPDIKREREEKSEISISTQS